MNIDICSINVTYYYHPNETMISEVSDYINIIVEAMVPCQTPSVPLLPCMLAAS